MKTKFINSLLVNGSLTLICLLWTIPTIGLLISSFRDRLDINSTGWWTIFPHKDWVAVQTLTPGLGRESRSAHDAGGHHRHL